MTRPIRRLLPLFPAALLALATTACDRPADKPDAPASAQPAAGADSMVSHDAAPGQPAGWQDDTPRPEMQAQVVLERLGFAPGVIDGTLGLSTHNALRGFQEAQGLPVTGELDEATKAALARAGAIPATREVTIPADFAAGPFAPLPNDPSEQAKLPGLGYASLDEKLGERFHTTPDVLHALNPGAPPFAAGAKIRVPNIGADAIDPATIEDAAWRQTMASLGVGSQQPSAARIVVSKKAGTLKAYDDKDKLIALFTVTTGSSHDPLPLGNWKIYGVDHNPKFHYNPKLFWDVSDKKPAALLPPGPNGPVGVVWIDLSKPHYGIHGTAEPQTIGRAQSHGCVRLTNWDVARLAQMVSQKTKVAFVA